MAAQDKASGKSQKITITSDKGRLSEDDIERMIREAEEHAEEDKKQKENIEAKNQLESYLYSLRTTINDTLKDKIEPADKESISQTVTASLAWLEENPKETKEVYDDKRKEVEDVASPIITRIYQASGGPPSSASKSESSDDSKSSENSDSGPTVEEVD